MANTTKKKTVTEAVVEEAVVKAPAKATKLTGTVANCEMLRVRQQPNTDAEILGLLNAGDTVEVKKTDDANWFEVKASDELKGYAMSEFISL